MPVLPCIHFRRTTYSDPHCCLSPVPSGREACLPCYVHTVAKWDKEVLYTLLAQPFFTVTVTSWPPRANVKFAPSS